MYISNKSAMNTSSHPCSYLRPLQPCRDVDTDSNELRCTMPNAFSMIARRYLRLTERSEVLPCQGTLLAVLSGDASVSRPLRTSSYEDLIMQEGASRQSKTHKANRKNVVHDDAQREMVRMRELDYDVQVSMSKEYIQDDDVELKSL